MDQQALKELSADFRARAARSRAEQELDERKTSRLRLFFALATVAIAVIAFVASISL